MIVLQVNQITKSFNGEDILTNVKLEVQDRDRVALVGRNGAGKSTLLKIIAGEMSYDSGEIIMPKNIRLGYLEQHAGLESKLSIWGEMMTIFSHLINSEKELRSLESQMADPSIYEDTEVYARVAATYDELQLAFNEAGGYRFESDIRSILHGMQFFPDDYDKPVQALSGGQKTRLALAKMLLSKPDLLILDEPTNHLDIQTLSFLENYLKNYNGAVLIVSHDRYFLDQVVNFVYEVSRHNVARYVGNYSSYLTQKAKNYELDRKKYEKQQEEKAKLEDFVSKNLARASTTKMAQSRRKVIEKTDWMDSPDGDEKSASFGFTIDRPSGNDVLRLEEIAVGYPNKTVSSNISFSVYKQDRIALVGPNGVGKSTLLKTIMKQLEAAGGKIQYGTNVQFGYYDQEQAALTGNKTALQELWDEWPLMNERDVRTVLGRFLFTGDDVQKTVSTLSGGEKARLALAKLMLLKANTLVLDEPTNHLDLDSKEVLENALLDFPGTIIFVSHDRYFINRIATKVIELASEDATLFLGDYDYYLEKKEEMEELALENAVVENTVVTKVNTSTIDKEAKKKERQLRRQLEELESQIPTVDAEIASIEEKLCDPEIFQDHEAVQRLQRNLDELKEKQDELSNEWLELQEQLEEIAP
ncbi:ABC-F family ATP-binding cassette domain-containing protein [Psychrobacillus sp. INOP01]|uniref:ABC-F family ATP-binding cassette domain-containing protein n=1 Tax=Psychrobacillus sp. INOP01 TaxID=2829187 RepID=UPI001BA5AD3A|nr:ABC-F family ATP-binding cassette domain-containing protein [Psychrobacillus sp. INOP01]QUG43063.1 ABC-F family ATP-binding cassette domain-containing protein [Psychrobacillus sp. INOP01]